ncbi:Pentalenene oxygenase [Caulifigura coniformis]|uniref:Pentalenene oxygenase n=1 Tax=Caulifigura coniformis TaxID=2527983 RepID=A0A517SFY3_9PLAN|nr:cytochrome P450 [Caulifigura coniformis]QDT55038.1 Pentalenene oxygenase [Caulifigura coniformis]
MSEHSGFPRLAESSRPLPVTFGEIAGFAKDPYACMHALWQEHGDVAALQEGEQRVYFAFGPEFNKQILTDTQRFHSRFFAIRGPKNSPQRRLTSGLLSMNGDLHKQHRRTVQEPFQKRAIVGYHDAVLGVSEEMTREWSAGSTLDINEEMTQYMLRLTSLIVFGLDCRDLALRIGELTETWVALNHKVGITALVSDPSTAEDYERLLDVAVELEKAVKEMIALRRSGRVGFDVLSLLLRAHDVDTTVNDDQLVGHIVLMFGAAHLTSAHSLTWTLFLLAQHPEVMSQLHAELDANLNGQPPRPEHLEGLTVLDRVLKESMRILPASSFLHRMTAEPVEMGPFQLPAGAVVIFSQLMTHHMPSLYPEPEKFHPDRWLTSSPSPYAYLPFGGGARMCIGAALGTMQLKISLIRMLQQFRFSIPAHTSVNARVMSTMLFPVGRIPMQIEKQDGQFSANPVRGNVLRFVTLPDKQAAAERKAA